MNRAINHAFWLLMLISYMPALAQQPDTCGCAAALGENVDRQFNASDSIEELRAFAEMDDDKLYQAISDGSFSAKAGGYGVEGTARTHNRDEQIRSARLHIAKMIDQSTAKKVVQATDKTTRDGLTEWRDCIMACIARMMPPPPPAAGVTFVELESDGELHALQILFRRPNGYAGHAPTIVDVQCFNIQNEQIVAQCLGKKLDAAIAFNAMRNSAQQASIWVSFDNWDPVHIRLQNKDPDSKISWSEQQLEAFTTFQALAIASQGCFDDRIALSWRRPSQPRSSHYKSVKLRGIYIRWDFGHTFDLMDADRAIAFMEKGWIKLTSANITNWQLTPAVWKQSECAVCDVYPEMPSHKVIHFLIKYEYDVESVSGRLQQIPVLLSTSGWMSRIR